MRGRIIVAVAAALLAGSAVVAVASSTDNPGHGTTVSFYAQATRTVTAPPPVGEWDSVAWDLYELGGTDQAPSPVGEPIGRAAGACFRLTEVDGSCIGWYDLAGRGMLTVALRVGADPVVVTGGTGEFVGAGGILNEPRVPGTANDRVVTVQLTGFNRP
jgi:hypothetical protein